VVTQVNVNPKVVIMIKVNEKCFSNMYDATKYVVTVVSEGKKARIRTVESCENPQPKRFNH
jgi:hypothetical protein